MVTSDCPSSFHEIGKETTFLFSTLLPSSSSVSPRSTVVSAVTLLVSALLATCIMHCAWNSALVSSPDANSILMMDSFSSPTSSARALVKV